MKQKRLWWLLTLSIVLILTTSSYRIWADNDKNTFVIDVASDART